MVYMAGRIYTPEFRADAVALWNASAGQRTMKDVATDLGITRETPRLWVRAAEGHAFTWHTPCSSTFDVLTGLGSHAAALVLAAAHACWTVRISCSVG
ncbi:transposase [Streptomyces sp. NPDC005151]